MPHDGLLGNAESLQVVSDFTGAPQSNIHPIISGDPLLTPRTLLIDITGGIGLNDPINLASIERKLSCCWSPIEHVHLEISGCTGGNIREADRIRDVLASLPCPISARVSRFCYSAGLDLYLVAGLRCATADASFLLHQARKHRDSLPEQITAAVLVEHLKAMTDIDDETARRLHHRTGADRAWIADEMKDECMLDVAGALQRGIVHFIAGTGGGLSSAWSPSAAADARRSGVYMPPLTLTQNYFNACAVQARIEALRG